jgi:hypothetical protein
MGWDGIERERGKKESGACKSEDGGERTVAETKEEAFQQHSKAFLQCA